MLILWTNQLLCGIPWGAFSSVRRSARFCQVLSIFTLAAVGRGVCLRSHSCSPARLPHDLCQSRKPVLIFIASKREADAGVTVLGDWPVHRLWNPPRSQ